MTRSVHLDFVARLERARASGLVRLDLTESDPARCGLGWDPRELHALLGARRAPEAGAPGRGLTEAREAVASYLAGHGVAMQPERVFLSPSRNAALRLALEAVCAAGDEVLVPSPARAFLDPGGAPAAARMLPYHLRFEGEWRLDRRSIRRAIHPRTRAVAVGNPAEPTGATLRGDELAFLEEICAERGLALVGDEASLDTALGPSASVARSTRCLALHVSGLSGICGLSRPAAAWVAVAGPDALAAGAVSRLGASQRTDPDVSTDALLAVPALLARREPHLEAMRTRFARNRAAVATASIAEAPWTLQWGGGGPWAVLQINPTRDEDALCLALLDEGVAVRPGHLDGLPRTGYLIVSLLPEPGVFLEALERLEAHLRGLP